MYDRKNYLRSNMYDIAPSLMHYCLNRVEYNHVNVTDTYLNPMMWTFCLTLLGVTCRCFTSKKLYYCIDYAIILFKTLESHITHLNLSKRICFSLRFK